MLQQQWFQSNNKFNQELLEPARTLRVVDCTLTFYLKTCEIPQVFSGPLQRLLFQTKSLDTNSETFLTAKFLRPIQRLFLRPKFSRPIPRLFLRPNISKPILRLFLRLKFFDTDTETFFRDQICLDRYQYSHKNEKKSWYREVSRRDITLLCIVEVHLLKCIHVRLLDVMPVTHHTLVETATHIKLVCHMLATNTTSSMQTEVERIL